MLNNAANSVKGTEQSGAGSSTRGEAAGSMRRREMRFRCDPAEVLLEVAGHPEPLEGEIVEVSKTGIRLRLETAALATSESVTVSHARMIISGQIRYCHRNDGGVFTGVRILQVQYTP